MAGLILLATMPGCSPAAKPGKPSDTPGGVTTSHAEGVSMSVKWSVTGHVLGKTSGWTEQDAQALLFKTLNVTDTEIDYDGQVCRDITFQWATANPSEYLARVWKTAPRDLRIDAQALEVIKTNCDIPGFNEYMRLPNGRLIVPIRGAFFFFDPLVAY
jgi:hypothetical protein